MREVRHFESAEEEMAAVFVDVLCWTSQWDVASLSWRVRDQTVEVVPNYKLLGRTPKIPGNPLKNISEIESLTDCMFDLTIIFMLTTWTSKKPLKPSTSKLGTIRIPHRSLPRATGHRHTPAAERGMFCEGLVWEDVLQLLPFLFPTLVTVFLVAFCYGHQKDLLNTNIVSEHGPSKAFKKTTKSLVKPPKSLQEATRSCWVDNFQRSCSRTLKSDPRVICWEMWDVQWKSRKWNSLALGDRS